MLEFNVFGVRIRASFWFFAVIAAAFAIERGGLAVYFLLPVAVHELGHLAVMAMLRCVPRAIRLSPFGVGLERDQTQILSYPAEIAILLGGVAVNLVLAAAVYAFGPHTMRMMLLSAANVAVAAFNLLPIGNLDGGRVARLVAERYLSPRAAFTASKIMSVAVLAPLFGVAIYLIFMRGGNITLLVTCIYLASIVIFSD